MSSQVTASGKPRQRSALACNLCRTKRTKVIIDYIVDQNTHHKTNMQWGSFSVMANALLAHRVM